MGDFRIDITATGGHGCDRTAQPGDDLKSCGGASCPDCLARAFVASLKGLGMLTGQPNQKATLTHWPNQAGQVVDDLVEGKRKHRSFTAKEEPEEFLAQFFTFAHLTTPQMRDASRPFAELAMLILARIPRNPERTAALRKLLEAKDCAVRAMVAKAAP